MIPKITEIEPPRRSEATKYQTHLLDKRWYVAVDAGDCNMTQRFADEESATEYYDDICEQVEAWYAGLGPRS